MALPPLDVSQTAPDKRRLGRPPKKRAIEPMVTLPEATDVEAEELNDSLPTLYPVRHRRWQPTPSIPQVDVPPEPATFSDNETALKQIHTCNIQDNLDLTSRTAPTTPTHNNNIPEVIESLQSGIFLACFHYVLITVGPSTQNTPWCATSKGHQ